MKFFMALFVCFFSVQSYSSVLEINPKELECRVEKKANYFEVQVYVNLNKLYRHSLSFEESAQASVYKCNRLASTVNPETHVVILDTSKLPTSDFWMFTSELFVNATHPSEKTEISRLKTDMMRLKNKINRLESSLNRVRYDVRRHRH